VERAMEAIRLAIIIHNYQIDVDEIALHGSRLLTWAVNTL
jgi:hypothetical protein